MPLTVLRDGHRELIRLLNNIIDAVPHQGATSEITQTRHLMAQATARHLANKNRLVIGPLSRSACPGDRDLARRLTDELLALRQMAIEHYGTWTIAAIDADPREFRMAVRGMIRMLERRFQLEEKDIHPKVLEAIQLLAAQRAA